MTDDPTLTAYIARLTHERDAALDEANRQMRIAGEHAEKIIELRKRLVMIEQGPPYISGDKQQEQDQECE